jgi:hypothetical protein
MMNMRTISKPATMLKKIRSTKKGISTVADNARARNRMVEIA